MEQKKVGWIDFATFFMLDISVVVVILSGMYLYYSIYSLSSMEKQNTMLEQSVVKAMVDQRNPPISGNEILKPNKVLHSKKK